MKINRTGFIRVNKPPFPLQSSFIVPFFPVLGSYFLGTNGNEDKHFIMIPKSINDFVWYRVLK